MSRPLICLFVLAIATTGCKKETKPTEPAKADKAAPTEPAPKGTDPAPAVAPDKAAPATAGGTADQSDPVKVVEFVFAAAAAGKSDGLSALCDPAGGGDGDVKQLCAVKASDPTWERFAKSFATGKVDGAAKIEGDSAAVAILFGPRGDKKETMNLKKIDGKWYLDGF